MPPYILLLFLRICLVPAEDIIQESGIKKARVGENVTLQCSCQDDAITFFFWYQQTLGGKPQMISNRMMHKQDAEITSDFMKRFEVHGTGRDNNLTITNLQLSDSATYFCGVLLFSAVEFGDGVFLHVQASLTPLQASSSESVHPGDSVTLNCTVHTGTCDGENLTGIHWFKHSKDPQIGVIYTHGGRNDQCERKPDTQTHTCVYNLPIKSVDRTHEGTYYCAVASCGRVLFGNGTRLHIQSTFVLLTLSCISGPWEEFMKCKNYTEDINHFSSGSKYRPI
uniref:Ig-like domain-containing protein n=1 Tax=Sphaeramia orbicularis TaxID=375764 RepID=A0A673CGZ5_9TELE